MDPWPFPCSKNFAVMTVRRVLQGHDPILSVFHDIDAEIWSWTFLSTIGAQELDITDAAVVALEEMADLDPTIVELADLPEGWCAWRAQPKAPWVREPHVSEEG